MKSQELYNKYYLSRNFERLELFQIIRQKYGLINVLYPGSFVHITPSFVFPRCVYLDSNKQAAKFFNDPEIFGYISKRKQYPEEAEILFYNIDFTKDFDEKYESFDLLLSQYAGFVSQACKKYLKTGGILLANNSHGDASMASIDEDFQLTAVYRLRGQHCTISEKGIDQYFIPKKEIKITRELLLDKRRGTRYTKNPSGYIFIKVK